MFAYLNRQREPLPRIHQGSPVIAGKQRLSTEVAAEPAYADIADVLPNMAGRRLVPPTSKSKSEGLLNYAELVFDEQTSKPK